MNSKFERKQHKNCCLGRDNSMGYIRRLRLRGYLGHCKKCIGPYWDQNILDKMGRRTSKTSSEM